MLTRTIALFSLCVAAALFAASQTEAQPGKGKGGKGFGKGPFGGPDTKKLESEIDRLRAEIKELEAKLERTKETARPKSPFEGRGKGKGDFKKKDGKKEMAKAPFGGKGWSKGGFGKGWGGFGKGKEAFGAKLSPELIKERYEYYKKLYEESQREARKGKGRPKGKGGFGPKGFEGKMKEMGAFGKKGFGPMGGFGPKGFEGKKKEMGFPPFGGKGPMEGFGKKKAEAKKETERPGFGGPMRGPASDSIEARLDRLTRELEAIRNDLKKKKGR